MMGPTIQRNLLSIFLSFIINTCVFTADIKQMYRRVLIYDNETSKEFSGSYSNNTNVLSQAKSLMEQPLLEFWLLGHCSSLLMSKEDQPLRGTNHGYIFTAYALNRK